MHSTRHEQATPLAPRHAPGSAVRRDRSAVRRDRSRPAAEPIFSWASLRRMAKPYRQAPPPFEGNDQFIAAAGTVAWAVALIVLVLLRRDIPASSHWWIWTCGVGLGLGLFGLAYVPRLKRSRARAASSRDTDT